MDNRFGTTSDMIIDTIEENGVPYLLAIDGKGLYMTTANQVDKLLADRNRYSRDRDAVAGRLSALGMNPEELWAQNQHRIKTDSGSAKKVNPLKASKRAMKG